jgi:FMN phosphatase YigB (HAD superfamily)
MQHFLFDLDGTLTNCDHRLPILKEDGADKWDKFFLASANDPINLHVAHIFDMLPSVQVQVWTGRGSIARDITIDYLQRNFAVNDQWIEYNFRMRPLDDFRTGEDLKQAWLLDFQEITGGEKFAYAFDDDPKMLEFYKRNNIPLFLV